MAVKKMRKSPLIAAGIEGIIGLVMIIVGAIFYNEAELPVWPEWVMWIGIVIFGLALIILVVAFIKKPGEGEEEAQTTETT